MSEIKYTIVESLNRSSLNTHAITKDGIRFDYKHFTSKRHKVPTTQEGMARLWTALSKEQR